jgi:NAD(P)H-dependent FMN reductase
MTGIRVLGIAGSLRRASYNRGLLRAACELALARWTELLGRGL